MIKIDVEKYQETIFSFIDRYEMIFNETSHFIQKCVVSLINVLINTIQLIVNFVMIFYTVARYTTIPLHWIWIKFWIKSVQVNTADLPIFRVGAHYVYGKPGAGKSTMTYHGMMDYAYMTGKKALTTAQMELPRKSLSGAEYYLHQLFNPSDMFKDGEQVASFPPGFNFIVYEEMLTKYNQRNNKEKTYNDEVIPMIGAMGTQRHQGIDLFYFISQLPVTDVQIMLMLKGYHIPKIKKAFDYQTWLKTGRFSFYIKGWKIKSYNIMPTGGNSYELKHEATYFYPNIHTEDMKFFNPLNMKKMYDMKPKLKVGAFA